MLAPAGEPTRTQLRAMTSLARQQGHEVTWYEPRLGGASVARSVRALAADLRGVDRLVVGDPFSGVIRVIITVSRPTEVTIVDDGTATLEFARQWAAGEQLTRWHHQTSPHDRRSARSSAAWPAARSRAPLRRRLAPEACTLRLFTACRWTCPASRSCRTPTSWVRARHEPPVIKTGADLVGTSLVESGVLDEDAYLDRSSSLIAHPPGRPLLRPPQGGRPGS